MPVSTAISPKARQLLQRALQPGEEVRWLGPMNPAAVAGQARGAAVVGWIGLLVGSLMGYGLFTQPQVEPLMYAAAAYIGLPILGVCAFLTTLPRQLRRAAYHGVYAVTNQRSLLLKPSWYYGRQIVPHSVPTGVEVLPNPDGTVDLVLDRQLKRGAGRNRKTYEHVVAFRGVTDWRGALDALRALREGVGTDLPEVRYQAFPGLSEAAQRLLNQNLQPGETVHWTSPGNGRRAFRNVRIVLLPGLLFLLVALYLALLAWLQGLVGGEVGFLPVLAGAFAVFALLLIQLPFAHRHSARQQAYVITDRRSLIVAPDEPGIYSYPHGSDPPPRLVARRNGTVDVFFRRVPGQPEMARALYNVPADNPALALLRLEKHTAA